MSLATLSGSTATACTVQIPARGVWWADCELDEDVELSGAVVLSLPGLEMRGTIVSGGPWQDRARYRVAGGAGQWGKRLVAKAYANDAGVQRSLVLADVSLECGETIVASSTSGTVGNRWAREAGPASRTIGLLSGGAWYVDESGATRLGARPVQEWDGDATTLSVDESARRVELAADDLSGLVPGVVVEGIEAVDVQHTIRDGSLRTTIWGSRGASSRLSGALERLVEALTSELRYRGIWSYRVVAQEDDKEPVDLQVERVSSGMPDLAQVRPRYGVPGATSQLTLGSLVLVAFVDGDPSSPVIVGGDDPWSSGFVPRELRLCDGWAPVVRYGDVVAVGAANGSITFTAGGPASTPAAGQSKVRA